MTLTGIECLWKVFFEVCDNLMRTNFKAKFVGNKAKRRISKWVFSRKQSTPNFSKNEDFLPPPPSPDTHTYVCKSGGKKCSFFGKFGVLFYLETPVLRFALLPNYQQIFPSFLFENSEKNKDMLRKELTQKQCVNHMK